MGFKTTYDMEIYMKTKRQMWLPHLIEFSLVI